MPPSIGSRGPSWIRPSHHWTRRQSTGRLSYVWLCYRQPGNEPERCKLAEVETGQHAWVAARAFSHYTFLSSSLPISNIRGLLAVPNKPSTPRRSRLASAGESWMRPRYRALGLVEKRQPVQVPTLDAKSEPRSSCSFGWALSTLCDLERVVGAE
jgi:hypothetical protein